MISNLKVTDKLIELAKKHPKTTIIGSLAFITAVILAFTLHSGGVEEEKNNMGDVRPPIIEKKQEEEEKIPPAPTPFVVYSGFDVAIDLGTTLTLEPGGGSYVGKVRVNNQAEIVLVDGEYTLVLYNVPQEQYNYDLSHDHRRLGYVPSENVKPLAGHTTESASPDERYVCFDNNTRIVVDMDDKAILTTALKGTYARVVGDVYKPEWSDDEWYIVAYGNFIGYMQGKNGTFISRDQMLDIINSSRMYLRITGTDVNLRSEPKKEKKNVEIRLNKGDEAIVLGHSNGWYHVIFKGIEGYISDEVTCLEEIYVKRIPEGLENLHFENSSQKTI